MQKNELRIDKLEKDIQDIKKMIDLICQGISPDNEYNTLIHAFPGGEFKFDRIAYNSSKQINYSDIFINKNNFNLNKTVLRPFINLDILKNLGKKFFIYIKEKFKVDIDENKMDMVELLNKCNIYHWNQQFLIWQYFKEYYNF